MKYALSFIFLLTYISGIKVGYTTASPLYSHFSYMFQHAGFLHLVLNLISLMSFIFILEKVIPQWRLITYSYLASVGASFFSAKALPTVGASGMAYCLIGIYIVLSLTGKKLRITDKRKYLFWWLLLIISTIATVFNPHINYLNHLTSLTIGLLLGIIENNTKSK